MKGLLAVLVVGLLGGGVAAVVIRNDAPDTTITHVQQAPPPVTETVIVPAAGQTLVTGTLQNFSSDGAVVDAIPTPFTINAVERGAVRNATVEGAVIDGSRKTIYWYAGQPLPVSGGPGGGLDLGPARVDVDVHGVTWTLTGTSAFKPGRYRFGSSVAVGSQGLATPEDGGVTFDADAHTVMTATDGVIVHFDSPALKVEGPGTVAMKGSFTLRTASGTTTATSLGMPTAPFEVTLAAGPAGITVTATLQGPVTSR
jgi:hypothetical protein